VTAPSGEKLVQVLKEYKLLGFPGAVGSFDVVHVWWNKCPASLRAACKGKEHYTSLGYQMTCSHTKEIHSCTIENYGADNDKSVVKFDAYVMDVHEGKLFSDVEFDLMNEDGEYVKYTGAYLICDGGYHKWRSTQCPLKHTTDRWASLWSCTLESVRKDIEGVYGILKSRFRFMKNPIELHNRSQITNAVHTICTLHNMLLNYDGLDSRWYEENDPDDDYNEVYDDNDHLAVIANRAAIRRRTAAEVGRAGGAGEANHMLDVVEEEQQDGHYQLRARLIVHFKKMWEMRKIVWLK
jgi:Plant transposon protein